MSKKKSPNALGNNRYFDPKMGTIGAFIMGGAVFFVNYKYGFDIAIIAALKQAAYTFLLGGIFVRLTENIATHYDNDAFSIIMAIVIAAGLTIVVTYLVHSMKGTPEPFESTIPTLLGAPPSYGYWAIRKRKQLNKLLAAEKE